ncbi:MAG: Rho termination factor N-terminal domain-containing protein, partial [Nakamurella sp.]
MTETTESLDAPATGSTEAPTATKGRARKGEGLSGMVLTDLKALAGQLGIRGTSGMRKGDLVAAIAARQNGAGASSSTDTTTAKRRSVNGATTRGTAAGEERSATEPTLPLGDLPAAADRRSQEPSNVSSTATGQTAPGQQDSAQHDDGGRPDAPSNDRANGSDQAQQATDRGPDDSSGDSDDGQRGNRRNRRGR